MSCYMSVVTFARAFSLKCFKLLNAMPCPDQIKRKRCICTYVSRLHLSPWPPSIARSNEKRLIFKAGIGMTCRLSCIVHHASLEKSSFCSLQKSLSLLVKKDAVYMKSGTSFISNIFQILTVSVNFHGPKSLKIVAVQCLLKVTSM